MINRGGYWMLTIVFLSGVLGGYHFGQWNKPEIPKEPEFATVAIIDCFNRVEWIMVLGPDDFRIRHASTMDELQIQEFMDVEQPIVLQTPGGLCI